MESLGHVEDMLQLFAAADIDALPSYLVGLSKSMFETAACGRPLIATNVTGCRSAVPHKLDGLLVPIRDAKALLDAIARLHDDPVLARRVGDQGRPYRRA